MLYRRLLVALILLCTAAPAFAGPSEPWYRGAAGKKRIFHLSVSVGGGLAFFASNYVFANTLASDECRWCSVPAIDRGVRRTLLWDNTRAADITSSVTAYVVAPIVGIGLLYLSDRDAGLPRFLDDTIPVVETVVLTQLVVQTLKFSIARQRPFARYGTDVVYEPDQHLSFPSGHSALGFAITAGAGMVCHWRGYWTEPYVWGAGLALSLSTEYLRIAADKHYFTDVLVGGLIGLAGGLTIPRLMRSDVTLVPMQNGVALATTF